MTILEAELETVYIRVSIQYVQITDSKILDNADDKAIALMLYIY